MRALAIDLYCGLLQAEFGNRANLAVKQLVARRAENPDHMALRVGSQSPCAIPFEIRSVSDFEYAILSAGLARGRHTRIPTLESIERRVLVSACGFVFCSSLRILPSRPRLAQLSCSFNGAISRAISAVTVWWLDRKVRAASSAISAVFRSALVFVSTYPACALCAVVAAPLFVRSDCFERCGTLSAKQIIHARIIPCGH